MTLSELASLWTRQASAGQVGQCWAVVSPLSVHDEVIVRAGQAWELGAADIFTVGPAEGDRVLKRGVVKPWLMTAQLAPRGRHQLAVMREADKLQPVTANLLLKSLEEPAAGTIFLLLLERDNLLPTLRSRVQVVCLNSAPSDRIFELPETVSAILDKAASSTAGEDWEGIMTELLRSLRRELQAGRISSTAAEQAVRLVTARTSGLNRRLQLGALLSYYRS